MQTLTEAVVNEQKLFCPFQECSRIFVKRVYGAIFWQDRINFLSSELLQVDDMHLLAKAAAIIQNMMVKARHEHYKEDGLW